MKKVRSSPIFCVFTSVASILIGKDDAYEKKNEKSIQKCGTHSVRLAYTTRLLKTEQIFKYWATHTHLVSRDKWKWCVLKSAQIIQCLIFSDWMESKSYAKKTILNLWLSYTKWFSIKSVNSNLQTSSDCKPAENLCKNHVVYSCL